MTQTVVIPNEEDFGFMESKEMIERLEKRLAEIKDKEPDATETITAYELVLADLQGGEL